MLNLIKQHQNVISSNVNFRYMFFVIIFLCIYPLFTHSKLTQSLQSPPSPYPHPPEELLNVGKYAVMTPASRKILIYTCRLHSYI